uniref:Uncharacterized protein n=1 Tax=Acrobeloides nanus TaxID=290746 RepID=A0A914EL99_9BILA
MNISSNESMNNSSDYQYEISYYDYNDLWSKEDLLLFGLICMIPVACGLPIYLLVLYIFVTKPEFKTELTYRMMVYYGLADLVQMLYYIIWAVMCISDSSFGFTISMVGIKSFSFKTLSLDG